MGIHLTNRSGGIGKVKIWINGKEATADTRGPNFNPEVDSVTLTYLVSGHPYNKIGEVSEIEVKVYNKEEYLISRGKKVFFVPEGDKYENEPSLFGIIIGTSNYSGDALDLKFAAKDANDFSNALKLVAQQYFSEDKVHINLLSTDNPDFSNWPTKENIENAFRSISSTANPNARSIPVTSVVGSTSAQTNDNGISICVESMCYQLTYTIRGGMEGISFIR